MKVETGKDFGYLDSEFQYRLLKQILVDRKFAETIISILNPSYFTVENLRFIAAEIRNSYETLGSIPDIGSLKIRIHEKFKGETNKFALEIKLDTLNKVSESDANDPDYIKDLSLKFCKQQELSRAISEIQTILDRGYVDDYDKASDIIRQALEVGQSTEDDTSVFDDIESVLAKDFREPIPTGIHLLDQYMNGGLAKGELGIILAAFGVGKALPNSNKVYTPEGYKLMGSLKVGDKVFGRNGKPTNVIGVYPQGIRPIYKISFNDDTYTFCDEEHLWAVNSIKQRNRSSKRGGKNIKLEPDHSFKVVKTSELINNLTFGSKKSLNYKIPRVQPVEFSEKELTLNPYILGVMLGDGYMRASRFSTKDMAIINEVNRLSTSGVSIKERCRNIDKGDTLVKNCLFDVCVYGINGKLRELGLYDKKSDTKYIPTQYLYNSIDNRLELLRGLLDTDGNVRKNGGVEYVTVSKQLAEDVRLLVLSLGGFCKLTSKIPRYKYQGVYKNGKKTYKLTISFPDSSKIIPFKLERKQSRVVNRTKYADNKFIKSIEYSHDEEATCIMVDDKEHLFVTDDFIVTHNTTAVTKIANTAFNEGKTVIQIFFEDQPNVIKRKHISCWTGIELNELENHIDEVKEVVKQREASGGTLILKKFQSDTTTIPKIKKYLQKKISQGIKPDIILLDYIDCVQPSKRFDDNNVAEGNIMREFESMLYELDIAGWTCVQGNRCVRLDTKVETLRLGTTEIRHVVEGDEILTHSGYKKITHVFPVEKQPVYRIKLKSGKEIYVSSRHEFPTKQGVLKSISTGLKIGDKLLTRKSL